MARKKKMRPTGIRVVWTKAKERVLAATADGGSRDQVG